MQIAKGSDATGSREPLLETERDRCHRLNDLAANAKWSDLMGPLRYENFIPKKKEASHV